MQQHKLEKHILEYYQSMYRLAFSYVKNPDDALDVVQESVYKAMKKAASIQNDEMVKSWLGRIVINTSLDLIRSNKKSASLEEVKDWGISDTYHEFDLHNALELLDEREHAVVVLRFFEDYKIKEIADVLNENENTVKTILYRSLKKLKLKLSEGENDELQLG